MARLEIRPFSAEFVASAGDLLAERHRAHRVAEPLLPDRYEDAAAAAAEVEALASADGASGSVALRGGRVVGYLAGVRKDDAIWGPNVWIEPAGHAVAEAEDLRDLYGAASERWVGEGRPRHYVVAPAEATELVDAWWRMSFGLQHALALREVPDVTWPENVRLADEGDVAALIDLWPVLPDHQARAPVFGSTSRPRETEEEMRAEILEDLANPELGDLVAVRDDRVVGAFQLGPVEHSSVHVSLARPERAVILGWAATLPDVRGSGAGVALTDAAFAWSRERGYETMTTDWRVTNLLSSRFWPRRGFRETFLRLYRHIP
jgi:ribosomal protein S18 acetylase RimI-like enzyme